MGLNVNLWHVLCWDESRVSLSSFAMNQFTKSDAENLRPSVLARPGQYRTFIIDTLSFFHPEISWKLSTGWARAGQISANILTIISVI